MNEFKGTPGPWKTHSRNDLQVVGAKVGIVGIMYAFYPGICRLDLNSNGTYVSMSAVEREANAKLISAAPELLEALQDGVKLIEFLINATPTGKVRDTMCDFNIVAQSAIKKAV